MVDVTSEQSVRELAILEYEKNLAKYQDSYSMEQAERRYNVYKRALVDAYKQKLLEVERLCNEELEKVRESASYLQPFKEIASQWSVNENDRVDVSRKCNDPADAEQSKIVETNNLDENNWTPRLGKVEVNMSPEILPACLKRGHCVHGLPLLELLPLFSHVLLISNRKQFFFKFFTRAICKPRRRIQYR